MPEKKALFRKESLDRFSSPEQLNDFIRVTRPGIWLILSAVIVLLIGMCVWGVLGRLKTTLRVPVVSREGVLLCYLPEADASVIGQGKTVDVEGQRILIMSVPATPQLAEDCLDAYALHRFDWDGGAWVFEARLDAALPDGLYEGTIEMDSVAPFSFLIN